MREHADALHRHRASRRRWHLTAALALLGCWAGPALADGCTVPAETIFNVGGRISFKANGSRPGAPISGWTPASIRLGECIQRQTLPRYDVLGASTSITYIYKEGSEEYSVYETGIAGVGMVASIQYSASSPWVPIRAGVNQMVMPAQNLGYIQNFVINASGRVKLIKLGDIGYGDQVVTNRELGTGNLSRVGTSPVRLPAGLVIRAINNPTCRVQTQRVPLGHVPLAAFSGAGPASIGETFDLELSCGSAVGDIAYEIAPRGGILNTAQAVIELDNPADPDTATGVGLQLLDGRNRPVALDEFRPFGTSAAAGAMRKTHKARYYQLGTAAPTPGVANATVDITLSYP